MARGLDFVMRLYLHHLLHEQAVKALVTLFACAAASKHWRLIENMIITKVLMSWPFYSIKQPCFISKSCTFKLFWTRHVQFWYISHMRIVALKHGEIGT